MQELAKIINCQQSTPLKRRRATHRTRLAEDLLLFTVKFAQRVFGNDAIQTTTRIYPSSIALHNQQQILELVLREEYRPTLSRLAADVPIFQADEGKLGHAAVHLHAIQNGCKVESHEHHRLYQFFIDCIMQGEYPVSSGILSTALR